MSVIATDSQDVKGRSWIKDDVERLVAWMEEHQENLRGKQAAWHKDVKDQVFAEDEWITVKQIKEKAQNMKNSWSKAHKIWDQSGEGVRAEDQVPTFNALLESKCPMFWRLDGIWGTRPNAAALVLGDSLQVGTDAPQASADETKDQELLGDNSNTPASFQLIESSDEDLEWEATPPRKIAGTTLTTGITTMKKRHHRDKAGDIQRILGDRGAIEIKIEEVRIKAEKDLQKERLAAEDKRWEQQLESNERIAKIQAEAQAMQFQTFLQMMSIATGLKGTFGGSGPESSDVGFGSAGTGGAGTGGAGTGGATGGAGTGGASTGGAGAGGASTGSGAGGAGSGGAGAGGTGAGGAGVGGASIGGGSTGSGGAV